MKILFAKLNTLKLLSTLLLFVLLSGIASAQAPKNKVVKAKSGDGIHSLLKDHGLSPDKYTDAFIELNKAKIGKEHRIFAGNEYKLPIAKETVSTSSNSNKQIKTYAIFGEKYKKVEIIDNQLSGAVFYMVAGHGGPDPGAVGKYNKQTVCEDEYAYDVTLRAARYLIQHGALVYVIVRDPDDGIRDEAILKVDRDEYCYPDKKIPLNQNARLAQRKNIVNKLYKKYKGRYQRAIIIHVDSRNKGEDIDVFFYHAKKSKKGKALNNTLLETFKAKYKKYQPTRGYKGSVSARGLYMLKYSHPVASYIELGNINHPRDQKRLIKKDNRDAVAKWLVDGLIEDFKNSKKK